jgi:haloalkane dehalogenase
MTSGGPSEHGAREEPPDHDEWSDRQDRTEVTVDGHDLAVAYYEAGVDNGGPPVVFLHGIPTWSYLWRAVAPPLADQRHVVAPDLLGYGNSATHDGFDRSIRAQEAMLEELLADLGAREVDLVAHDVGGGVALRYAAHEPDRVRRLVLSNAVCYDSWPVEFVAELGLPETARESSVAELRARLEPAFADGVYADEADPAFVEGMTSPWLSESGKRALSRAAVATNTNHTTEIEYGRVTAETLLLWGGDDVMQPVAYAERLAGDVAGDAEVVALDRAYHWVVEDRPDAYREHLRPFLADTDT